MSQQVCDLESDLIVEGLRGRGEASPHIRKESSFGLHRTDRAVDSFLHLLACPKCRGMLTPGTSVLSCLRCNQQFPIDSGIPLLFHPHEAAASADVTETVKAFYEKNPFPNYDDLDT